MNTCINCHTNSNRANKNLLTMRNDVASTAISRRKKKLLWRKAIKWPLYSVAIMPIMLATSWTLYNQESIRIGQFFGFLFSSVLILMWENLSNDLFDAETGVDEFKLHSVINLVGKKEPIKNISSSVLLIGLILISILAFKSSISVLYLVLLCCFLGYLYQGPPFRLAYKGLGEPLCWLAFGPLATSAAILVISNNGNHLLIPWIEATKISAGPALATTLILFCSHFHQTKEDQKYGKKTLIVKLGTKLAAKIIPTIIGLVFCLEIFPIITGEWPIYNLLCLISLLPAIQLIKLLNKHHNQPDLISDCKFIAVKFQTINGLGLCIGFLIGSIKLGL